jgi:hypothetical protein
MLAWLCPGAIVVTIAALGIAAAQTQGAAPPMSPLDMQAQGTAEQLPPLVLGEKERQAILQAVDQEKTIAKPPEGFQPRVGAKVPPAKQLALHPLPRPLVYQFPELKQYAYGKLADTVLIVDPMSKTVVATIAR